LAVKPMRRRFQFSLTVVAVAAVLAISTIPLVVWLLEPAQEWGVRFGNTEVTTSGPDNQNVQFRYFNPGENP
jgi:hypothetical protein